MKAIFVWRMLTPFNNKIWGVLFSCTNNDSYSWNEKNVVCKLFLTVKKWPIICSYIEKSKRGFIKCFLISFLDFSLTFPSYDNTFWHYFARENYTSFSNDCVCAYMITSVCQKLAQQFFHWYELGIPVSFKHGYQHKIFSL